MAENLLNNYPVTIRLRRPSGGVTGILSTQKVVFEAEPLYATDTRQLFIGGSGEYDRYKIPCLYAKTVSGNYSPVYEDVLLCNAITGNLYVTLPSASGTGMAGMTFNIKKIDGSANNVIISGAQNIDGYSSVAITDQYQSLKIFSNNQQWYII
jgi:hypothetical protein